MWNYVASILLKKDNEKQERNRCIQVEAETLGRFHEEEILNWFWAQEQLYEIYRHFDRDRSYSLDVRESLCLVGSSDHSGSNGL